MALTSLNFVKEKGKYVGKFTASGPFAVEVKGVKGNVGVKINYTGVNDEYAPVKGSYENGCDGLYVKNIGSGTEVYPVFVAVECDSMPERGGYSFTD